MYCKTFTLLRHSGQEEEFLIRQCKEADLSDIMELQQKVYDELAAPELYAIVEEPEIHESLLEDYCYGTYHNGRLVAFKDFLIPGIYRPRLSGPLRKGLQLRQRRPGRKRSRQRTLHYRAGL